MPEHETIPRPITTHRAFAGNLEHIDVVALDAPGPGGANHLYQIIVREKPGGRIKKKITIPHQYGPIVEAGINGVMHEALVAIVIDRLEGFQNGPFRCAENAEALAHFRRGLEALHRRTRDRHARGVEGRSAA